MKNKTLKAFALAGLIGLPTVLNAGPLVNAGGTAATPSEYVITLSTVEFKRADGSYYEFFSGTTTFDIASAGANSAIGSVGSGNSLEPGVSYTAMRVTIATSYDVTGGVANAGFAQPCQTGGAGSGSTVVLTGVNFETGNATGGVGTTQALDIPTDAAGTTVADALSAAGMERIGNQLRFEVPLQLTVPADNTVPPALSVDFDVADQLEFLTTGGGTCAVMVLPPIITLTTPTGTTTLQANL